MENGDNEMAAKAKTDNQIQFDEAIAQFIALRNRIDEIKAAQEQFLAPFKEAKEQLAGVLVEWLDQTGQTSAKTAMGTVFIRTTPYASLGDPDAFMEFIAETGAFELMDRRANATACLEYAEENGGLPPGVKINVQRTAGVRKS
jgi:hypothetical protein